MEIKNQYKKVTVDSILCKKLIAHPYTALMCRIVLGAVFIYASWNKIIDPEAFARSIINYRILPPESVNILAIILPWLELVCGFLLILGLCTGGSVLIIAFLLILFFVAMASALMRRIDISCGCFSPHGDHTITVFFLLRDMVLFALALQVFLYDRRTLSLDRFMNKKGSH